MPKKQFNTGPLEKRQSIILTATRACNLRCKYCYESSKDRGTNSMDIQTAKNILIQYMNEDNGFDGAEISFFGGEPLLNFNLIKDTIEWFVSQRWNKAYIFFIGTNGTILTEEMKGWFREHKNVVVIGYSLDGNRTAHNLTRDNSYDLLFANIPFFQDCWPFQPAKMTISKENIPYLAESIIELENMRLNFTANLVYENIWGNDEEKKMLLGIYEDQLYRLVDFYAKNPDLSPVSPILSRTIETYNLPLSQVFGIDQQCVRYCGAGHEMVLIDVDGTSYPCHRFVPWVTGKPAPGHMINRQKEWAPAQCSSCKLISTCPTCAGYNWEINGDTGIRSTYHCEAFKIEFLASAKLHAMRLNNIDETELRQCSDIEILKEKARLNAIIALANEGV